MSETGPENYGKTEKLSVKINRKNKVIFHSIFDKSNKSVDTFHHCHSQHCHFWKSISLHLMFNQLEFQLISG